MTIDPERLKALAQAKLRALVIDLAGAEVGATEIASLGVGAGLITGDAAYAYTPADPMRALGPMLAWLHRSKASKLHLLVDEPTAAGSLAQRAMHLEPSPTIWVVDGRSAVEAQPAPVGSAALSVELPEADTEVGQLVALLRSHGLEISAEHGVITGELNGMEVARVLDDELGVALAIGVGHFDREAGAMLRGNRTDAEALSEAIAEVKPVRSATGPPAHPLNRLVRERWLRAAIVAHPNAVGLATAAAISAPVVPASLLEANPASAIGLDVDGDRVLVVCGLGTNLDLVSSAAAQAATQSLNGTPVDRIVVAVPLGDALPITTALIGYLRAPAEVVEVAPPWPS